MSLSTVRALVVMFVFILFLVTVLRVAALKYKRPRKLSSEREKGRS